jgi:hypothetical protein
MQENSKMSFKTLAMKDSPDAEDSLSAGLGDPGTMAKRWQRSRKIACLCGLKPGHDACGRDLERQIGASPARQ